MYSCYTALVLRAAAAGKSKTVKETESCINGLFGEWKEPPAYSIAKDYNSVSV
jgi:hypothetical protein